MTTETPIGPPLPGRVVAVERGGVTAVFDEVPVNIATGPSPLWVRPSAVDLVCRRVSVEMIGGKVVREDVDGTHVELRGGGETWSPLPLAEVVALLWPNLEADV